jgi:hypothetical protein
MKQVAKQVLQKWRKSVNADPILNDRSVFQPVSAPVFILLIFRLRSVFGLLSSVTEILETPHTDGIAAR